MFLFPCVGCASERETWSRARLFPEIQEKEMGLLNKTERADAGVPPAGCGAGNAAHAEGLRLRGAPCLLGSILPAGMTRVRSGPCYSDENPENTPGCCITLRFCCVTECSSSDAEFKAACVKSSPLVKN